MKSLLRYCLVFTLIVLIGFTAMLLAYSIPVESIENNVARSAADISEEGPYPVLFDICTSKLDNFTDSWILLMARDDTATNLLDRALCVYYHTSGSSNTGTSLVFHYAYGEEFNNIYSYGRYWHGDMIIVKPLLVFWDYSAIRVINGVAQFVLTALVVLLLFVRKYKELIIPYLISYLMMMPMSLSMCLFYSPCFYVMSLSVLCILVYKSSRWVYTGILFLAIGMMTSYFDSLTFPLVTFGIPCLFITYIEQRNTESDDAFKTGLLLFIRRGAAWCIGYGGMWITKWIMLWFFTDHPVWQDIKNSLFLRSGLSDKDTDSSLGIRLEGILRNIRSWFYTPVTLLFIFFLVVILVLYCAKYRCRIRNGVKGASASLALVSFLPFAWLFIVSNHSFIHEWFANKTLVVFTFGTMVSFISMFKNAQTANASISPNMCYNSRDKLMGGDKRQ